MSDNRTDQEKRDGVNHPTGVNRPGETDEQRLTREKKERENA